MVRKSGSQLRDSQFLMAESALSAKVGQALRDELGSSRRATKTVMGWTDVSDRTARAWISGRVAPSGSHLLALAANSQEVMIVVLRMTGHSDLAIVIELQEIEQSLLLALTQIRAIIGNR